MAFGKSPLSFLDDFEQSLVPKNVSIIDFAQSIDFCHRELYPRQKVLMKLMFLEDLDDYENMVLDEWIAGKDGVEICPMIRERIKYLKENGYQHFRIVQIVGGRRLGKGFMTSIAIARKVWQLIQSDDPSVVWGIDRDKDIYIPIVAAKQQQAKDHQYGDIQGMISSCAAMQRYVKRVREESISVYTPSDFRKEAEMRVQGIDYVRDLAKIRIVPATTASDTLRGATAFAYVFDEFAHGLAGESRRSMDEVYNAAVPSLAQFGKDAILFANSSPYTETGKFFELYKESMTITDGFPSSPEHLMIRIPSWCMYYDWDTRSNKIGPMVSYDMVKAEERVDPEKFNVEYRAQFAKTQSAFLNPEKVDEMFEGSFQGRTLHTAYAGVALHEYMGHGDPASTTANFGFAMAHIEYVEEIEKNPLNDQILRREMVPHIIYDLVDAFYPDDMPNKVIDWELAVDEIVNYIRLFRPRTFSFDQFSIGPLLAQVRRKVHDLNIYDCRLVERTASLPKNQMMWDTFKAALYLGRLHAPNPKGQPNERSLKLAMEELKFLVNKNGRVIKQDIGSVTTSDICVTLANLAEALIGEDIRDRSHAFGTHLQAGAPGGYPIRQSADPFQDFYRDAKTIRDNNLSPLRGMPGRNQRRRRS